MEIEVRNNNVDKAMRILKKKMKKEGLFDLMKEKQYYQKPSFKKRERAKRRKINIKKAEKLRQNFIQEGNESKRFRVEYICSTLWIF